MNNKPLKQDIIRYLRKHLGQVERGAQAWIEFGHMTEREAEWEIACIKGAIDKLEKADG